MRKNFTQSGTKSKNDRTFIENDWYSYGIPANVHFADNVYIDTSYAFAAFHSKEPEGLFVDEASGCYDRSSFIVGKTGQVTIGKFSVLNGTVIICNKQITIGDHCLIAWSSVITDTWLTSSTLSLRQSNLKQAAQDPLRGFPFAGESLPVVLEDNTWVGFGSVIMPGVRLGKGCIVGSKTIITEDVPPYAIVVGDPPRIIKYLEHSDTEEVKARAIKEYVQKQMIINRNE
jgi:acetyltransferase-like isoleucine patch superfamily enzyme